MIAYLRDGVGFTAIPARYRLECHECGWSIDRYFSQDDAIEHVAETGHTVRSTVDRLTLFEPIAKYGLEPPPNAAEAVGS